MEDTLLEEIESFERESKSPQRVHAVVCQENGSQSSDEFDEEDERFMNDEEKARLEKRRIARETRRVMKAEEMDRKGIDYERLTEFFFDLCLSWCQFLDIETFLFFINGVFLNITKGNHINVS